MTECWSEGELRAYHDGELPVREMSRVREHLLECAPCAGLYAELSERSARLAVWLLRLPEPPALSRLPDTPRPSRGSWRGAATAVAVAASLGVALILFPKRTEPVWVAPRPQAPAPAAPKPPLVVKPAIIRRAPRGPSAPVKPRPRIDYYVKLDDEPIETGLVVRVGLNGGEVPADVIVGPDGRARAIRLVNDFSGELK